MRIRYQCKTHDLPTIVIVCNPGEAMTVHVYPENDWIEHRTDGEDCPCEPRVQYIDEETGLPLDEPLVIHNALDGRD